MKAAVLTIGDEILRGRTVDSNFSYIAKRLFEIGIGLAHHRVVGDIKKDIVDSLEELSKQADLVFITGGLGPTPDDLTRFAIAEFLDSELTLNKDEYAKMENRFEKRDIKMPPSNEIQVKFPEGIEPLYNPVGMAPGMYFEKDQVRYWVLPGVPREMKAMMSGIIKKLDKGTKQEKIVLRTTQIPESALYDLLKEIIEGNDEFIGYYPSVSRVDIVIRGDKADEIASKIRPKVDGFLYSAKENQGLNEVIQQMMIQKGLTLATAESCTGGMIASEIVDVPGSSEYFLGGVVSYSNEAKMNFLDVPEQELIDYGAVSSQVAKSMAKGAREKFGTDYAISTTGIAGPEGGTDEKPVGLVYVAVAHAEGVYCRRYNFNNTRQVNRIRSKSAALFLLSAHLKGSIENLEFLDGSREV
ncbi:MAG: competence/damage-inducible protein A [Candidatus Zixiibacteriota bacterium]